MIKNLIFDVGEVLFEYRWKDMLMDHGVSESETIRIASEMFEDEIWSNGLDTGLMTQAEALDAYREKFPEDYQIISWFVTHGELMQVPRPEIWSRVRGLKEQGYGIYLLSNYSQDLFEKHTKGASFLPYVDGKVVSYMIHKIKPDPAIYEYLLNTYHLRPEECLFFDDRLENVEGARKLGIHATQVTSREMLRKELDGILEKPGRSSVFTQNPSFGI